MINKILIVMLGVILIAIGWTSSCAYDQYQDENSEMSNTVLEYNECNDLNLKDTSNCLREYVSGFYNYTVRSDEIRNIDDIKENGGDCYDYNKLYERLGKELGFDTFSFRIKIGEGYHRIAIISDETGYCLLDQLAKVKCFRRDLNE